MSTPTPRTLAGIVVSAGKMMKTVKVRIAHQVFNPHIRKYFPTSTTHLVHDPSSAVREGDIVRVAAGWRVSRRKRHVVTEVVAAFGEGVERRGGGTSKMVGDEGPEMAGKEGVEEGCGERGVQRRGLVGLEELVREREERREAKRVRREGRRRMGMVGVGEVENAEGR